MAMKVEAGPDMRRGDCLFVDPYQIKVVEKLRGRHRSPDESAIIAMADSMLTYGQRQPVECRRVKDNKLQLVAGFTRMAASRLIRDGFLDQYGAERQDKAWMLKCVVVDANDEESFCHNLVENEHRNNTSEIDDAHNHRTLRDVYGYDDTRIKALYGYRDPNKIGRLRRLLELPASVQAKIHAGEMGVQAGLDLLELPEDEREGAIAVATNAEGNVNGAAIKDQIRSWHLRDEPGTGDKDATGAGREEGTGGAGTGTEASVGAGAGTGTEASVGAGAGTPASIKAVPRTPKVMKAFLGEQAERRKDDAVGRVASAFLDWMGGRKTDRWLVTQIEKVAT
jgi:ParB-like chromosome segregation protein Spo0J